MRKNTKTRVSCKLLLDFFSARDDDVPRIVGLVVHRCISKKL